MVLRQTANDVLRNDVMLRINDVELRTKGKLHFCSLEKILLKLGVRNSVLN